MGKLRLSVKERDRSEVLSQVAKSSIGLMKASELLGVSYRQVLRLRLNLSVLTPFCYQRVIRRLSGFVLTGQVLLWRAL